MLNLQILLNIAKIAFLENIRFSCENDSFDYCQCQSTHWGLLCCTGKDLDRNEKPGGGILYFSILTLVGSWWLSANLILNRCLWASQTLNTAHTARSGTNNDMLWVISGTHFHAVSAFCVVDISSHYFWYKLTMSWFQFLDFIHFYKSTK